MSKKQQDEQPPEPPEIKRRILMYPMQIVGMTLIALVPLLALLGIFGEVQTTAEASNNTFLLQVEYPLRTRHRVFETMAITVTNESAQAFDTVTVRISEAYINAFAEVAFDIEVEQITPEAYEFALTNVQPGESRVVGIEVRADEYGQRDGWVTVTAPDVAPLEITFGTFVFP